MNDLWVNLDRYAFAIIEGMSHYGSRRHYDVQSGVEKGLAPIGALWDEMRSPTPRRFPS